MFAPRCLRPAPLFRSRLLATSCCSEAASGRISTQKSERCWRTCERAQSPILTSCSATHFAYWPDCRSKISLHITYMSLHSLTASARTFFAESPRSICAILLPHHIDMWIRTSAVRRVLLVEVAYPGLISDKYVD